MKEASLLELYSNLLLWSSPNNIGMYTHRIQFGAQPHKRGQKEKREFMYVYTYLVHIRADAGVMGFP